MYAVVVCINKSQRHNDTSFIHNCNKSNLSAITVITTNTDNAKYHTQPLYMNSSIHADKYTKKQTM